MDCSVSSAMDSLVCSICVQLLVKPVALPCGHEFCLECLKKSIDEVSLLCPLCRKRISLWARKRKLDDDLVNKQKWNYILDNFKELLEERFKDGECMDEQQPLKRSLYLSGELRNELLLQENKMKEERLRQVQEEEQSSLRFIQTILSAEESNAEVIADELFARQLQEELLFEPLAANKYNFRRRKYVDYFEGNVE